MNDETGYTPRPRALYLCTRCDEQEPGAGGPFDVPIPKDGKKPKCATCGKTRWINRQWSGFRVNVSGTNLTPTQNGTIADGRHIVKAADQMGPEWDRQRDVKSRARMAQQNNPYAAKLVGAGGLAGAIQGVPLAAPGQAGESRPLLTKQTVLAGGMLGPRKMGKTNVVGSYTGDGKA